MFSEMSKVPTGGWIEKDTALLWGLTQQVFLFLRGYIF